MTDLPEAFTPKQILYTQGDPLPYAIREDGRPMPDDQKAYRQGYNAALEETRAATLREALKAAFPACIGYDGPGHIEAHNKTRMALLELGAVPDGVESTDIHHPEAAAYRDERHVLQRERDALKAALFSTLTESGGLSEATADRIIEDTLRTARGEP